MCASAVVRRGMGQFTAGKHTSGNHVANVPKVSFFIDKKLLSLEKDEIAWDSQ